MGFDKGIITPPLIAAVRRTLMAVRCVLWDFGETLVDQDWMLNAPDEYPKWSDAWVAVARGELEEAWNLGHVDCDMVASRVAKRLGMSLADAVAHIQLCCSRIRFFSRPLLSPGAAACFRRRSSQ